MSVFSEIASIDPHQVWDGVLGRVVEGENATLAVIELEPGAVVPEHRHVNEQMGVLIQGSLSFRIGEETRELAPGGMWCIPADVPHEVRVGPDGAVLVEAFAPRRADWAGLEHRAGAVPRWP
ncbi:MAG TPA: cupin domain-containing protein [Gaiellaceae bacterium]|jgi:quercetin dioxygenase-like cupin family protein|nr:cupin domain-containing protein [Gaiellaceae bacterium]